MGHMSWIALFFDCMGAKSVDQFQIGMAFPANVFYVSDCRKLDLSIEDKTVCSDPIILPFPANRNMSLGGQPGRLVLMAEDLISPKIIAGI